VIAARIGAMHVLTAVVVVAFADLLLRKTAGGLPTGNPAIRIVAYTILAATGGWMILHAVGRLQSRRRQVAGPGTSLVQDHLRGGMRTARVPAGGRESGLLAIAVGLVPCTGSILILSIAIANGVLWAGYLLVAAIAIGMTFTMALLAQGVILLNRTFVRDLRSNSLVPRLLELAGALAVTSFGLLLLGGTLLS
jgi:ABC-type nickel/cobalt efflux system permease component RcnA